MMGGFEGFSSPLSLFLKYHALGYLFSITRQAYLKSTFYPKEEKRRIICFALNILSQRPNHCMFFSIYCTFFFFITGKVLIGVFEFLSPACLLNFQSAFSGLNYLSPSEIGAVNKSFRLQNAAPRSLVVPSANKMNIFLKNRFYLSISDLQSRVTFRCTTK